MCDFFYFFIFFGLYFLIYIYDFRFLNNVFFISFDVFVLFNDCCGEKIVCVRFNYEDEKMCVLFLELKYKYLYVYI